MTFKTKVVDSSWKTFASSQKINVLNDTFSPTEVIYNVPLFSFLGQSSAETTASELAIYFCK